MWIGRIFCVLGALAALAGLVAGWQWPQEPAFDLLTHFRIHLLGAALSFALAAGFRRLWPVVLLGGVAATLFAVTFAPVLLNGKNHGPWISRPGELNLVQFNTWRRNDDWRTVMEYLRKRDADIVVLIEAGEEKKPLFAALRTRYPWQTDCSSRLGCRLAILSKRPWREARIEPARGTRPPVIWARFAGEAGDFTLMGTHLTRPPYFTRQRVQAAALAKRVARVDGPVIVVGDFNATPWSFVFQDFRRRTGLHNITGNQPSWPAWPAWPVALPQIAIDHAFVSAGIARKAIMLGPASGSDHLPINMLLDLSSAKAQ